MLEIILISILAGVLTILTPCSITLLPVILGSGLSDVKNRYRPYIIILSLVLSVFIFSLLIKATTLLIDVPLEVWRSISASLIIILGLSILFPSYWDRLMHTLGLMNKSERVVQENATKSTTLSSIITGVSLGPIFSGCSPTYILILSVILPTNFSSGITYLLFYSLGLGFILLLVLLLGRKLINNLKWAVNPSGKFKKILGLLLLITGLLIFTGLDKVLESALFNVGFIDSLLQFESELIRPRI